MTKWLLGGESLDQGRDLGHDVGAGEFWSGDGRCECWWGCYQVVQVLGSGLWIGGGHEGADDCDAVESLGGRCGLEEDSLDVLCIDAADADGLDVWVRRGQGGEDGLHAGCAYDRLAVFFAVSC